MKKNDCAPGGSKQISTDPRIVDKEVPKCNYCQEMYKNSSYKFQKMEMKKLSSDFYEIVGLSMEKSISEQKNMKSKELKIILKRIDHQFESLRNGSITQGPLKKWTEHSQDLHLLKIHTVESRVLTGVTN